MEPNSILNDHIDQLEMATFIIQKTYDKSTLSNLNVCQALQAF